MLTISATEITQDAAIENELGCVSVDFSNLTSKNEAVNISEGCTITPTYAVTLQPAEDMVIPIFLCLVHFNALKIALHEGVGADEDVFGSFS